MNTTDTMDRLWDAAERVDALLRGDTCDRTPLYPFLLGFCARNVGYPLSAMYDDPQKSFQAQCWTYGQYGFDGEPEFGYASYGGWEFGGEIEFPQSEWEQAPSHGSFAVQEEADLEALRLPDVTRDGMLPRAMEFSRRQQQAGMRVTVVLGGPFTIAGNVCPVETLSRWLIRRPKAAHRLIRMATDHLLDVINHWVITFGAANFMPKFWEPLAANHIISPRQFEEYVLPYLIEISQGTLKLGVPHLFYHVCGEQNLNLPHWSKVPVGDPGIVSVGHQVDIDTAIRYFGEHAIIAGNVEPALIQTGTPQEIFERARACLRQGAGAPRGYMLMPGCEIPPMSPPFHVHLLRQAVEQVTGGSHAF